VQLAEDGFRISPRLAKSIERAKERGLTAFDASRRYFFTSAGTPRPAGSLLRNPDFARTLRQLAKQGIDAFYHGDIGRAVVDAVRNAQRNPGSLTRADLARYRTIERTPVCINYHQHRVCGMGPPSSGGLTVGQILGILSRFDLAHLGYGEKSLHLFAEAAKLAYADRDLYMADHDFSPVPVTGLLNSKYLDQRADLIKANAVLKKASAGHPPGAVLGHLIPGQQLDRTGTSHLSIIDTYGNVLSMTTTIETGFGSRLMVGGFLLNNELTDFSFQPQRNDRLVANRVQGGKRPRSSMAPTIVFDQMGQPVISIGSPGGSRISNYVAQAVIGLIDWELNPQQAASQPHVVNRNGTTEIESSETAAALSGVLRGLGHDTKIRTLESGLNIIKRRKNGILEGGTDPRREGQAVGG
jgi:gamma-glutamyltranspeptidase/glutathione hydrolase